MHMQLTNKNESAWSKGDQAYALDDTLETGVLKAQKDGYRPGSNGYAAFITAFSRRVRSKEVASGEAAAPRMPEQKVEVAVAPSFDAAASAGMFTPNFLRVVT